LSIRKIGSHEKRIANDIIHKISRDIVNQAVNSDAMIVLGDIKHLRKRRQNTRGRKFNRKLAGFQYYKLTQYIKYNGVVYFAHWDLVQIHTFTLSIDLL
jgi:putative transposase